MLISLPFLWMTEYTTNPNQCYLNMTRNDLAFVFAFNTLLIFIPTIGLSILYIMIIVKLKQRNISFPNAKNLNQLDGIHEVNEILLPNVKRLSANPKNSVRTPSIVTVNQKNGNKTKNTIIISIVTVVFYCCQLPARLFLCWSYLNDSMVINFEEQSFETFYFFNLLSHIVTLIYFLHSVSNPIIYNLLSSKFRKAFMSVSKFKNISSLYLITSKSSIVSNYAKK